MNALQDAGALVCIMLSAFVLSTVPSNAQNVPTEPLPDSDAGQEVPRGLDHQTTGDGAMEPWTYYPIELGMIWEYNTTTGHGVRIEIPSDTTIESRRYFHWNNRRINPDGTEHAYTVAIRYDSTEARLMMWEGAFEWFFAAAPCRLDSKLPTMNTLPYGADNCALLDMGTDGTIEFADTTLIDQYYKTFDSDIGWFTYFSGIGPVQEVLKDGMGYKWLTYFSNGDIEYGAEQFPVRTEILPNEIISISHYPNPVRDRMFLEIMGHYYSTLVVHLHDILGREILKQTIEIGEGRSIHISLDLNGLSAGIYLLTVDDTNGWLATKLITKVN